MSTLPNTGRSPRALIATTAAIGLALLPAIAVASPLAGGAGERASSDAAAAAPLSPGTETARTVRLRLQTHV